MCSYIINSMNSDKSITSDICNKFNKMELDKSKYLKPLKIGFTNIPDHNLDENIGPVKQVYITDAPIKNNKNGGDKVNKVIKLVK